MRMRRGCVVVVAGLLTVSALTGYSHAHRTAHAAHPAATTVPRRVTVSPKCSTTLRLLVRKGQGFDPAAHWGVPSGMAFEVWDRSVAYTLTTCRSASEWLTAAHAAATAAAIPADVSAVLKGFCGCDSPTQHSYLRTRQAASARRSNDISADRRPQYDTRARNLWRLEASAELSSGRSRHIAVRCFACLFLPCSIVVGLPACSSTKDCTAVAKASLLVTVVTPLNVRVCDATVTATDGSFSVELLRVADGSSCAFVGPWERTGTYSIEAHHGDAVGRLDDVKVATDACHVRTRHMMVTLNG